MVTHFYTHLHKRGRILNSSNHLTHKCIDFGTIGSILSLSYSKEPSTFPLRNWKYAKITTSTVSMWDKMREQWLMRILNMRYSQLHPHATWTEVAILARWSLPPTIVLFNTSRPIFMSFILL